MTNDIAVIEKEAQEVVVKAKSLTIATQQDYETVAMFMKTIKGLQKKVADTFDPIVQAAHKTWKEALGKKDEHLKPLMEAEAIIKQKSIAYVNEQDRKARDAQEKLGREARAEEERKRKALEERARKAEEAGKAEKAEELRQKAEEVKVEAPVIAPTFQKVNGQSFKDNWYAEVVDFSKLPDAYKLPNIVMLNKMAKATKGSVPIPGVVFKSEKIMSSSSI